MGLAAGTILYLCCLTNDEAMTQKDIAEAAGVLLGAQNAVMGFFYSGYQK